MTDHPRASDLPAGRLLEGQKRHIDQSFVPIPGSIVRNGLNDNTRMRMKLKLTDLLKYISYGVQLRHILCRRTLTP